MSVSLIDLPYLIELVLRDIKNLENIVNSPNVSDEVRDVAGESLMQAYRTAANLQSQYEHERRKDSNFSSYEDLLKDIQERIS